MACVSSPGYAGGYRHCVPLGRLTVQNGSFVSAPFWQTLPPQPGFETGFATGKLTKDFINDVKPGYFANYVENAYHLDSVSDKNDANNSDAKGFGGYVFKTPCDPPVGKDWRFTELKPGDPLLSDNLKLGTNIVTWAIEEGEKAYKNLYAAVKNLHGALIALGSMHDEKGKPQEDQTFDNRLSHFIQEQVFMGMKLDPNDKEKMFKDYGSGIRRFVLAPASATEWNQLGITDDRIKERCVNLQKKLKEHGLTSDKSKKPEGVETGVCRGSRNTFWKELDQYITNYATVVDLLGNPASMLCMMLYFFSLYADAGGKIEVSNVLEETTKAKASEIIEKKDFASDIENNFANVAKALREYGNQVYTEIKAEFDQNGLPMPSQEELVLNQVNPPCI